MKLNLILVIAIHVVTWAPVMPMVIISSVTAHQGIPEINVQFVPWNFATALWMTVPARMTMEFVM